MVYTLIKDDVAESYESLNDEELIAELDRRSSDLASGKVKAISLEESKSYLGLN